MDSRSYHLLEAKIANNPGDPRHIMPSILASQTRVLDVGCGAGQTLLANYLAADTVAVGVDPDLSALLLGRQLGGGIRFVCARGEALPFKSEYFDLVISRVALPYMHIRVALAEMCRVLKSDGSLWIVLHPLSMMVQGLKESLLRLDMRDA